MQDLGVLLLLLLAVHQDGLLGLRRVLRGGLLARSVGKIPVLGSDINIECVISNSFTKGNFQLLLILIFFSNLTLYFSNTARKECAAPFGAHETGSLHARVGELDKRALDSCDLLP